MRLRPLILAASVAAALAPSVAAADIQHTVARGHTLEAIANRYHVTVKQIVDANHLKDTKLLHPGDVLTIPTKESPAAAATKKSKTGETDKGDRKSDKKRDHEAPSTFASKAKTPGVIHVKRIATNEEFDVRVNDKRGRISPTTLKTFEKMMRSPSGMAHPIEPRLVSLLGIVSNHFGSRKIEVISGFRPFTPTQYNPHSNHMHGKAVDFRVAGVPNEVVRDFCRTLKNVGCGYYPNSVFVHMDVRDQSAFWIDYSKPGEAPRYNAPDVQADEGASDVRDDGKPPADAPSAPSPDSPASNAAPAETPMLPPPSTGDATKAAPGNGATPPTSPAADPTKDRD